MTPQDFEKRYCFRCGIILLPNQMVCPLCGHSVLATPSNNSIPLMHQTAAQLGPERPIFATPVRNDFKPCRIVPGFFVILILGAITYALIESIFALFSSWRYYSYINPFYIILLGPGFFFSILHIISIKRIINKKIVMVKDLSFNAYLYFISFFIFIYSFDISIILVGLSIGLLIAIAALRVGPWLVPPSSWAEMKPVKNVKCQTIIHYLKALARWKQANEYISIQDFARYYNLDAFYVAKKLREFTSKRLLVNASIFGWNAYFRFERFGLDYMNDLLKKAVDEGKPVQAPLKPVETTVSQAEDASESQAEETVESQAVQPDIQIDESLEISAPNVPQRSATKIICPHCGIDNSIIPDGQFCLSCGKSLALSSPPSSTAVTQPRPKITPVICPHCGKATTTIGAKFCMLCGKSLVLAPAVAKTFLVKGPAISGGRTDPSRLVPPIKKLQVIESRAPAQQKRRQERSIFEYTSNFNAMVLSASFMKNSRELCVGTSANALIRKNIDAIDVDHRLKVSLQEKALNVLCLTGRQAVFCTRGDVMKWSRIHVIDPGIDKITRTISSQQSAILSVALCPSGHKLVAGGYDKLVELWDIESGDLVHSMKSHGGPVNAVAVDSRMQFVVSGSRDKTLKIWDLTTGDLIRTLDGHDGSIISVAVSPDGSRIASGSDDCTIRIWDIKDDEHHYVLKSHKSSVTALLFSSDGQHLISGSRDTTVKIWNMNTKVPLQTITKHTGTITTLALSSDETMLVTGSADRTARYWSTKDYFGERQSNKQDE
jgi:WD40 repeat protein